MEGKFRDFSAGDMAGYIKANKVKNDDEWLEIEKWIDEFLKSNPPEDEKRLFVPLGWAESVCIICDGIKRWRASVCYGCSRKRSKYLCDIYDGENGEEIPAEIWARDNAECPFLK